MATEKTKEYSWDEIKKHNTITDLWVVIDGKVYDVSEFVEEHPGGDGPLMEQAGKDASAAFADVGHSEGALEQLGDYVIGVAEQKIVAPTESAQPNEKTPGDEKIPGNEVSAPTAAVATEKTETGEPGNKGNNNNNDKKEFSETKKTSNSSSIKKSSDSIKKPEQSAVPPQTTSSFYKSLLIPILLLLIGFFVKFYWTSD